MRTASRRASAWTASYGFGWVGGLVGLGVVVQAAGCGRTDAVLYVDTDHEGTSFSYEDVGDGDGDPTDTETTDTGEGVCGDGIVDWDEDCDDQNDNNNDACTNECLFNVCGDGFLFEGVEECDPGAANIGPNQPCVPGCKLNVCGDGFEGPDEQCDDGNMIDGDGCNSDCTLGFCGNGIVDPGEECDDQNLDNSDECLNSCEWAECGDGFLFEGVEECDPGAANIGPNQPCVPGCKFNVCGDGFVGPGEQCDDGNLIDGDGCNSDCTLGTCGNGIVDPGEECDDQNLDDTDECLSTCMWATCGDGFVRTGFEECDEGPLNSDSAECTLACTLNVCGDAKLWEGVEQCDPGIEQIGPGMQCLPGCVQNVCGDGDKGPNEQCDDGNDINTDDCTNMCMLPVCGDGFVWEGHEECDDQNLDDNDACHNDCTANAVVEVGVGGNHVCAMFNNGTLSCWGNGHNGRTGYATEENLGDDEPAGSWGLVDIGDPIVEVEGAISHTCVRYAGGQVRCFGRASDGQLGYGNVDIIGDDEAPSSVGFVDLGGPAVMLTAEGGSFHNCALLQSGALVCWGLNTDGRLGYGLGLLNESVGDDETPAEFVAQHGPVEVGGTVTQLVSGFHHTCALLDDATLRCWGAGTSGQLGYGNSDFIGDDETPASAGPVSVGGPVVSIGAGWYHTCAILTNGEVKCWGRGNDGRLGYGNTAWVGLFNTPESVGSVDLGGLAVKIDGGNAHTCALLDDGTIRCWGWGARGQLGYGNPDNIGDNEPPASAGPVDIGGLAVDLFVDGNQTCAIRDDGRVLCWGDGGQGRLGYGSTANIGDDETPASVGPVPLF
ncbi:MAG: DUF4215 domain-containing protein [Enhygromyxa sp.]